MKVGVETGGTIKAEPGEVLDRPALEEMFDRVAEALVEISEFEADVSMDYGTQEVRFFVVVDATTPGEAVWKAEEIIGEALEVAGVKRGGMDWTGESHTRRADLVPA